jgi:hypothetical protein
MLDRARAAQAVSGHADDRSGEPAVHRPRERRLPRDQRLRQRSGATTNDDPGVDGGGAGGGGASFLAASVTNQSNQTAIQVGDGRVRFTFVIPLVVGPRFTG